MDSVHRPGIGNDGDLGYLCHAVDFERSGNHILIMGTGNQAVNASGSMTVVTGNPWDELLKAEDMPPVTRDQIIKLPMGSNWNDYLMAAWFSLKFSPANSLSDFPTAWQAAAIALASYSQASAS